MMIHTLSLESLNHLIHCSWHAYGVPLTHTVGKRKPSPGKAPKALPLHASRRTWSPVRAQRLKNYRKWAALYHQCAPTPQPSAMQRQSVDTKPSAAPPRGWERFKHPRGTKICHSPCTRQHRGNRKACKYPSTSQVRDVQILHFGVPEILVEWRNRVT